MKKILFILLALALTVTTAKATLWDFYGGDLPSISERAIEAQKCGIDGYSGTYEENIALEECLVAESQNELSLGGTTPIAGATYTLAGSGISSTATSIILQSFTIPQTGYEITTSDLPDTFYITIEPGSRTRQEIVSCTTVTQSGSNDTATLSGCTRGLKPFSPYTEDSDYKFAHAGGSQVILSDPPQLFNLYTAKANNETITGYWDFTALPTSTVVPTSTAHLVTKSYVDNSVNQGAATSTESVAGIAELATQSETALGTAWGSTEPHVIQSQYATSTPSGDTNSANYVVVSESDGKLNQLWFDLTDAYTFSTSTILAARFTNATTTGSLVVEGDFANANDGFISTVSAENEAVIPIPTGARRAIVSISADCSTVNSKAEITLTFPGKTSGSVIDVLNTDAGVAWETLTATSTATEIGYNVTGTNETCSDGTDATAWFYRY